jgi:hypothetical protein
MTMSKEHVVRLFGIIVVLVCLFLIYESMQTYYFDEKGVAVSSNSEELYATVDGIGVERTIVKEYSPYNTSFQVFITILISSIIGIMFTVYPTNGLMLIQTQASIKTIMIGLFFVFVYYRVIVYLANLFTWIIDYDYYMLLVCIIGPAIYIGLTILWRRISIRGWREMLTGIILSFYLGMGILIEIGSGVNYLHHHGDWAQVDGNGIAIFYPYIAIPEIKLMMGYIIFRGLGWFMMLLSLSLFLAPINPMNSGSK